ncbi:MAG: hypothetical protein E6533_14275 [Klebsiella pneumoniae]|jgi:ORF064|nr:hypothetical protein [Klebsiella pneumoniae]
MAKNKTLTIYNSDRYFNIHTKDKKEISKSIKITHANEEEIEKNLDKIANKSSRYILKDDNTYMLFNEKYNNDRLIEKVCKHGGGVYYYTDSIIPYYVFKDLSTNQNSAVVYKMRERFSDKEIDNIALSFMGTKVIIDISVVLPYVNPYEIIRNLHPIKTNVDEVHLTFPKLRTIEDKQKRFYDFDGEGYILKPEYKIDFAERIRVSLSVWKMYIYILTSEEDHQDVTNEITKLKKQKNVKL